MEATPALSLAAPLCGGSAEHPIGKSPGDETLDRRHRFVSVRGCWGSCAHSTLLAANPPPRSGLCVLEPGQVSKALTRSVRPYSPKPAPQTAIFANSICPQCKTVFKEAHMSNQKLFYDKVVWNLHPSNLLMGRCKI